MLNAADHQRIAEAVSTAEDKTSGEIFCIVAEEVSHYREVPVSVAAAVAFILPPVAILLGLHPWTVVDVVQGWSGASGWDSAVPVSPAAAISLAIAGYAAVQALLFAVTVFVASIPAVRRALTPGFLKRHRVQRTAYAHFASTGLAQAKDRTGVLIFASVKDRQVHLIADEDIHKAVGDSAWDASVAALVKGIKAGDAASGFVRAVEICGGALAEHFPPTGPKLNQFPDIVEV